jgi:hypothetical protein
MMDGTAVTEVKITPRNHEVSLSIATMHLIRCGTAGDNPGEKLDDSDETEGNF